MNNNSHLAVGCSNVVRSQKVVIFLVPITMSKCIVSIQVQQYCRDDNGRHQVVKFDTNLVKQRLQHGYKHNTIHGNTRIHGFRAKITPDSNEDAVVELRREIK